MSNFSRSEDLLVSETRTVDVASPIAAILQEVIDYTGLHRRRFGNEPAEGSPADLEINSASGKVFERRLFDIEATHQNAAGICILSAGYLFASLTQLYRPDMALFGFQVVARATVENSMKAWWLVDPAVSIDTRLARLYADNLENINQMIRVGRLGQGDAKLIEKRRAALVKRAQSIGVKPLYNRKNKLIGFGQEVTPGSTEMAAQFFKALGYEDGEFWYRSLSAICHGTAYGLLGHLKMVDAQDSDLKALEPHLSVLEVANVAVLSVQAYLGAIEFDSRLMGWDSQDVAQHRQEFQVRMLSILPK